jgi:hypothetical protein
VITLFLRGKNVNTPKFRILAVLLVLAISLPLFAEIEPKLPDASLLDTHNLAGIGRLSVYVMPAFAETNEITFDHIGLEKKVEQKLKDTGIDVIEAIYVGGRFRPTGDVSELRIFIAALKVDDQRLVFYVETSLATTVTMPAKPRRSFLADIWKAKPAMVIVAADNIDASLEKAVFPQVEQFTLSYRAANAKNPAAEPAAEPAVVTVAEEKAVPRATRAVSRQGAGSFVASKNGKVFHKRDCASAKRINPENLLTFKTRDEAEATGRTPCKQCKP